MRVLFAVIFLAVTTSTIVDAQYNKYWLELTDKSESPYRIDQPQEFLSDKAIERRLNQGIPVDIQDLPVSTAYEKEVKALGAKILYSSKWFNALAISCDETVKNKLKNLPFVKSIRFVGYTTDKNKTITKSGTQEFESGTPGFGFGSQQMELLNGQFLHEVGYHGEGKMVAVIDGGFIGLERSVFFDSLRSQGLLLPSKDLVDVDGMVSKASTHGTKVLSVMAANKPGVLIGMAPKAAYVCIRTEDQRMEMPIEECNWIAGAEYADSIGADIINTSLGYSKYNDPSLDYSYLDMDGQTSMVSQAADIAFSKGILVVTSAGNSGTFDDGHIDAPGDAKNILTVGATNMDGSPASFSSYGPTADGRIKPEIVAPGRDVSVASIYRARVHSSSGTSYSAPMISGLAAALWSAFPEKSNIEIRDAIIQSATHPGRMNNKTGAGLPDFQKAYYLLKKLK